MRVAVIFSGGLDSCVLASKLEHDGHDVWLITMDDRSPNYVMKDRPTSYAIAQKLGIARKLVEARIYDNDALRLDDEMGYIPGYKMVMMTTALSHAAALKCDAVAMGYCNENGTYADEHVPNVCATFQLFNKMYGTRIAALLPFISMDKAQIVNIGLEIKAPMELSSSCDSTVHPGVLHCGQCKWCENRRRAFRLSDAVTDPTLYAYSKSPICQSIHDVPEGTMIGPNIAFQGDR